MLIICEYLMDGSLPATPHATPLHGRSVNLIADLGQLKNWVRATSQRLDFSFITPSTRWSAPTWLLFLECQSGIPPTRARWTPFGSLSRRVGIAALFE
jgi:hypothetical protein